MKVSGVIQHSTTHNHLKAVDREVGSFKAEMGFHRKTYLADRYKRIIEHILPNERFLMSHI